jgi:hypothetical protein
MRRITLLLPIMLLLGCARAHPELDSRTCACDEPGARAVDPALMAWLSKARSLHHVADLAENDNAPDQAVAALDQLVSGTVPAAVSPEVDEVLADTFARLADLESLRGEYDKAERRIASGLERAREISYFRGHLLEVRGLVLERLAKQRATEGKSAEAAQARKDAMRASVEAVHVQDEVIKRTLGGLAPATRDR